MLEKNIKSLIKILEESAIDEMEISTFWGRQRIRIRKNTSSQNKNNIDNIQDIPKNIYLDKVANDQEKVVDIKTDLIEPIISHQVATKKDDENIVYIKAPLVGTFYSSPKPGDPPFISKGDLVKEGQIICIIEAMKIFNEIESDVSGIVEDIIVKDSTPVEYDQDLIQILTE